MISFRIAALESSFAASIPPGMIGGLPVCAPVMA